MPRRAWSRDDQQRAEALRRQGLSLREIARLLGRDHTTVRRHLQPAAAARHRERSAAARARDPAAARERVRRSRRRGRQE